MWRSTGTSSAAPRPHRFDAGADKPDDLSAVSDSEAVKASVNDVWKETAGIILCRPRCSLRSSPRNPIPKTRSLDTPRTSVDSAIDRQCEG